MSPTTTTANVPTMPRPPAAEMRQSLDAPFTTSVHLGPAVLARVEATPAELATLAKCKRPGSPSDIDPERMLLHGIAGRAALLALRTLARRRAAATA